MSDECGRPVGCRWLSAVMAVACLVAARPAMAASAADTVANDAAPQAQQCHVQDPTHEFHLASGRQIELTMTNDGSCRFGLFQSTVFTNSALAHLPFDSVAVVQNPAMGRISIRSGTSETWFRYRPNAGFTGHDYVEFRMLPGNGRYQLNVTVLPAKVAPPPAEPHPATAFIYFNLDRDDLTTDALGTLEIIGREMTNQDLRDFNLQIAGHADAHGTPSYNVGLSERRVDAVRRFLVARFKIDPTRVSAAAFGDTMPIDPQHPYADVNRRVHLTLVRGRKNLSAVAP